MEKKVETTIAQGLGSRDNGKENGNYYLGVMGLYRGHIGVMGLYRDNGKANGSYRDYRVYMLGVIWGSYWDNGKENGATIVYWGL